MKERTSSIERISLRLPSGTKGISLVESIIGIALILLSLVGVAGAHAFYLKAGLKSGDNLKAAFLLQEGMEVAVLLRDDDWGVFAALSTTTLYDLSWSGSSWTATTVPVSIEGMFRRTIALEEVMRRDSDQDIVASSSPDAKSVDTNSRKVTVRVTGPDNIEKKMSTYLTNLFE